MLPLLELAQDGKIVSLKYAEMKIAKTFQLTQQQQNKLKPSGGETTFANRLRWARLYLRKAGLIRDPKIAHYQITNKGKVVLKLNLKEIDEHFLKQYPDYVKWKKKDKETKIISEQKGSSKKIQEHEGIVILLDALGTKKKRNQEEEEKFIEDWTGFNQTLSARLENINGIENFKFLTFSDTILITVWGKRTETLIRESTSILEVSLVESMLLKMPLRGCISTGKFRQSENLILGEAVYEAAKYYELPQWIGISAAPSTHKILEKMFREDWELVDNWFSKTDIPMKTLTETNGWAIKWPDVSDSHIIDNAERITGKEYDNTLHLLSEYIEDSKKLDIVIKWRNTLKFYNSIIGIRA